MMLARTCTSIGVGTCANVLHCMEVDNGSLSRGSLSAAAAGRNSKIYSTVCMLLRHSWPHNIVDACIKTICGTVRMFGWGSSMPEIPPSHGSCMWSCSAQAKQLTSAHPSDAGRYSGRECRKGIYIRLYAPCKLFSKLCTPICITRVCKPSTVHPASLFVDPIIIHLFDTLYFHYIIQNCLTTSPKGAGNSRAVAEFQARHSRVFVVCGSDTICFGGIEEHLR